MAATISPDLAHDFSKQQRLSQGRLLLISIFWFAFSVHWGPLLAIMMPSDVQRLVGEGSRGTWLALVLNFGAVFAIVIPPLIGAFSDRSTHRMGRRRPYMIIGTAINIAGLFIMMLVSMATPAITPGQTEVAAGITANLPWYMVGYVLVQFGNGVAGAAYNGIIPDLVPQSQRGAASGYMGMLAQLGTIGGVLIAGSLFGAGQYATAYLLIIGVVALFLAVSVLFIHETPRTDKPAPLRLGQLLRSLWISPRQYPDFAWVWFTRFLVGMGLSTINFLFLYFVTDVVGSKNPEADTATANGALLIGATISVLIGGWLSDRIGRKPVIYFAGAVMSVFALAFALFGTNLTTVLVVALLFGLGYGAYYSVDWALGTDVLPSKDDAGKDLGIWHVAIVLPQVLSIMIAGPLLDALAGLPAQQRYLIIFSMPVVYFILGTIFVRQVRSVR